MPGDATRMERKVPSMSDSINEQRMTSVLEFARDAAHSAIARDRRRMRVMARRMARDPELWDSTIVELVPRGIKRATLEMW